jgi:N-methylhydantoinase A
MPYVLGIDIGGTFTDAFAAAESGLVASAKTPSTAPDFARGFIDVLHRLAAQIGVPTPDLLAQTSYICHGTTSTLNALVTGEVARVGFITTRGHADALAIMGVEGRYAGLGPEQIQHFARTDKPPALVPRRLVREVDERIDHLGSVVVALNEDVARAAVRELLDAGVEAMAVSLLWSFRNPAHELRIRQIAEELAPGLYVGLSSEVSPRIREYPRGVTTIMNTQVAPRLRDYLLPLEGALRDLGFGGSLLVMQGSGGSVTAREAPRQAIGTIGGILSGGVVGCQTLGAELGHRNIISTDMGGTTFLVGMVTDGQPARATTTVLNQYRINTPTVAVHTIGAGGGAVAWLDAGGNLRVGPRSAGAVPGPACYGQGGTEPTVTDADLVLGILNPGYFLGGEKRLDPLLAAAAIETHIAGPLGMSAQDAAAAIYAIQNAQTSDLVRRVVVNAGHDPRDFVMYAFGGAGPVHCASYAADTGVRELLVPLGAAAATFSAYGLAASDIVLSAEMSKPGTLPLSPSDVSDTFAALEKELAERQAAQGVTFESVTITRELDLRYTQQLTEVPTPVAGGVLGPGEVSRIGRDFEDLYERRYGQGTGFREAGIQAITYRVFSTGHLPARPRLPQLPQRPADRGPLRPRATRRAMLDQSWQEADVFGYADLAPGDELTGPAIVEAPTTTVVLPNSTTHATVDRFGNLSIRST